MEETILEVKTKSGKINLGEVVRERIEVEAPKESEDV